MEDKMIKILSLALCIFMIISCSPYSTDELLSAPEEIEIQGREYFLGTNLYRNFFPPGPPTGLYGTVYVIAVDSLQFPSSVDTRHLWVIMDDDVWDTDLGEQHIPGDQPYTLKAKTESEGPDWGPHIYVSTVVEIVDENDNLYLLRADSQWIGRLD
jgi:hypothetical protein